MEMDEFRIGLAVIASLIIGSFPQGLQLLKSELPNLNAKIGY